MKVTRRFPNFVEQRDAPEIFEVYTLEEFEAIEFIKQFMSCEGFVKFSYSSESVYGQELLMVEFTDDKFWAIGYITDGSLSLVGFGQTEFKERPAVAENTVTFVRDTKLMDVAIEFLKV